MISKPVVVDDVQYNVEIREIDQFSFWSQNIAIARAYAKVHEICHYPLLERLAQTISHDDYTERDFVLLNMWSKAFGAK